MFFSHSFLPLHFLGSDLHCCLSEQLVGLLCDPGSTLPHTLLVGWASSGFLRWGHSPAQKPLRLHYFPENEIGKHKVQVIFTDLCVSFFIRGLHASGTSLLFSPVAFPPGSGMTSNRTLSTTCASTLLAQTPSLITQTLGTSLSFDSTKTLHFSSSTYSHFSGYLFVYTFQLLPPWDDNSKTVASYCVYVLK